RSRAERDSLSRWPMKIAAAQEVQVQMGYGLAGALLTIDHQAIPLGDAELLRQLGGDKVKVAEQLAVLGLDIGVRGDDLTRDDQDVHRRLGIDIPKRQAAVVFVDDGGRDL